MDVLFAVRNDGTDVRVRKEINTLIKNGKSVTIYLASDNSYNPLGIVDDLLTVNLFPRILKSLPLWKIFYLAWLHLYIFFDLLRTQPVSIHAIDEEMILICCFARLTGVKVVLDLFDSVELKLSGNHTLKAILLKYASRMAKNSANVIIVTDSMRYELLDERYKLKGVIIPNYPSLNDLPDIKEISAQSSPKKVNGKVKIFLGGTLYRSRGLNTVMRALDMTPNLILHCAGWIYDNTAKELIEHPQVIYHGVVDQKETNKICSKCLVNLALYEPSNLNNIYASPNKVYDSLCIGQYVLLNEETELSKWISKSPLVKTMAYDNAAFIANIEGVCQSKISVPRILRYRSLFVWEKFESVLLNAHKVRPR